MGDPPPIPSPTCAEWVLLCGGGNCPPRLCPGVKAEGRGEQAGKQRPLWGGSEWGSPLAWLGGALFTLPKGGPAMSTPQESPSSAQAPLLPALVPH